MITRCCDSVHLEPTNVFLLFFFKGEEPTELKSLTIPKAAPGKGNSAES